MTRYINRKTAVIAIAGVGVVAAALLAVGIVPSAASAFGPGKWMHGGWHGGFGPGHFGANSTHEANWTGSVPVESIHEEVIQSVKSRVNITVSQAESAATQSIGDGSQVFAVMLAPVNGYLVYMVHGIDGSNQMFHVIVDAGNGEVLESGTGGMGAFGPWKGQMHREEMWR